MKGKYLLLGTNLGNKLENLNSAIQYISAEIGQATKLSSVYKTAAWGKQDQPDFFNQVIRVQTHLTPAELLNAVLDIEYKMGRIRSRKWKERVIDIDILYYEDEIIHDEKLIIPHPEIANRRFTLVPLCEIAINEIHPELAKTQGELLSLTKDRLEVKVI